MNLRLSTGEARFRVSEAEARQLLDAGEMSEEVRFPGGARIRFSVRLGERLEPRVDGQGIQLAVPRRIVESLLGPDAPKELAARAQFEGLKIAFEVDRFSRSGAQRTRLS